LLAKIQPPRWLRETSKQIVSLASPGQDFIFITSYTNSWTRAGQVDKILLAWQEAEGAEEGINENVHDVPPESYLLLIGMICA